MTPEEYKNLIEERQRIVAATLEIALKDLARLMDYVKGAISAAGTCSRCGDTGEIVSYGPEPVNEECACKAATIKQLEYECEKRDARIVGLIGEVEDGRGRIAVVNQTTQSLLFGLRIKERKRLVAIVKEVKADFDNSWICDEIVRRVKQA